MTEAWSRACRRDWDILPAPWRTATGTAFEVVAVALLRPTEEEGIRENLRLDNFLEELLLQSYDSVIVLVLKSSFKYR